MNTKADKTKETSGQSLVELAITLPVLLLLFLGLIELGMAMRANLVLNNAVREAARLAGRGVYTSEQIAQQALNGLSQLPVQMSGPAVNTAIIVTCFAIPAFEDAGKPYGGATYSVYATGTVAYSSKLTPTVDYINKFREQNRQFNDQLVATHPDAVRGGHDIVFVELYYLHHQLLNAPLVEWVFPDPMVLYSKAMMRIGQAREY